MSVQDSNCGFYLGLPAEVAIGHVVSVLTETLGVGRRKRWGLGWRRRGVTEQVWDWQLTVLGLVTSLPPPSQVPV